MDINKYIGKFLVKNKYCSLPGLGVFDLKKESASINVSKESISGPVYKITFTPVGSIDDTFASFIASAENVSISNASNNIREYCKAVKEQLAATGKYEIEYFGRFVMSNQKIGFEQAHDLDLGGEPAPLPPLPERSKQLESNVNKPDYSYPPARQQKEKSVLKIVIPILVLGLLATAAYFGYDYYKKNNVPEETVIPAPIKKVDTMATVIDSAALHRADSIKALADTLHKPDSTSAHTPQATTTSAPSSFNVAILSYETEAAANAKANKLKSYGNKASVQNYNGKFFVLINASVPFSDSTKLVDSLRRFFNPKGSVFIMK